MAVITFNTRDVIRNLDAIPDRILVPATVRALNKVAANVRTSASTGIRKKRSLSARAVREALVIGKATRANLTSRLIVTGRPVPLKEYKARETRQGVVVSVTPGSRKLVTHQGNKAFISSAIGDHVFARQGKARLPIKKLFGPSIPSTFLNEEVKQAWVATAKESIVKRTAEELRFEMSRHLQRARR